MSRGQTAKVILDSGFGEQLLRLPGCEPVWVIESPVNSAVAKRLWKEPARPSRFGGITTFKGSAGSPADVFLNELGTIDLHHGQHSASPPYSVLEVIGCGASQEIRTALDEIGFKVEATSSSGFTAVRKDGK
jgi:hypothetical protein